MNVLDFSGVTQQVHCFPSDGQQTCQTVVAIFVTDTVLDLPLSSS